MKFKRKYKFALIFITVLAISPAYFKLFTIAGPSMAPTYWWNDKVISNHLAYDFKLPYTDRVVSKTGKPKRGDLIIYFDNPKNTMAAKRIIGLPGDTVAIRDQMVYLNGTAINQNTQPKKHFDQIPEVNAMGTHVFTEQINDLEYLITYTPNTLAQNKEERINTDPITVSEGNYYILGDNRDNSADSRYIGLISREQIQGKVIYGNRTPADYNIPE